MYRHECIRRIYKQVSIQPTDRLNRNLNFVSRILTLNIFCSLFSFFFSFSFILFSSSSLIHFLEFVRCHKEGKLTEQLPPLLVLVLMLALFAACVCSKFFRIVFFFGSIEKANAVKRTQ